MAPQEPRRQRRRIPWRYLLIGAAALLSVLTVAAGGLLVYVQSDAFEAEIQNRLLPIVSERLERQVTVGGVNARVLPMPSLEIHDLRVEGLTPTPIFTSSLVSGQLRLWPLIRSWGEVMILDSLRFLEPELNLVPLEGGGWDIPSPPESERDTVWELQQVVLQSGSFHIFSRGGGRTIFELNELQASASYVGGMLAFRDLGMRVYGGLISASGTAIDLSKEPSPWTVNARLGRLDPSRLPFEGSPLRGLVASTVELTGAGVAPSQIGRTMTGTGELHVRDLIWETLDLEAALISPLRAVLGQVGVDTEPIERERTNTQLGGVETGFEVEGGWITFIEPFLFESSAGGTSLSGRIRLDMAVDLDAETRIDPDLVATLTDGSVTPAEPVPISYRIRGNVTQPRVEEVDVTALLPTLEDEAKDRLQRGLERLFSPFGITPVPPNRPP